MFSWACRVLLQSYDKEFTGSIKSTLVTVDTDDSCLLFSGK